MQVTIKNFLQQIEQVLTKEQIVTDKRHLQRYSLSPRGMFQFDFAAALLPRNSAELAKIMQLAYKLRQPIVPQGGNSGLVGGQQPTNNGQEIAVLFNQMNKIIEINEYLQIVTVEAGVNLAQLQNELAKKDLFFPLKLASEYSCEIGGNLATNAGGCAVLQYGTMRDLCLGLEVVLPNGDILSDLRYVKKDNMGYDLKNLFIGSEGSLGLISKANLKIFPRPVNKVVAYISCSNIKSILDFFVKLQREFAAQLTSYELISQEAFALSLAYSQNYIKKAQIFAQSAEFYALIEISQFSAKDNSLERFEDLFAEALEQQIISEAILAQNLQQAEYFWQLRENISAAQKYVGKSIKNDISVPIIHLEEFLAKAKLIVKKHCYNARIICFGHIGDGNLHYNILQPLLDDAQFLLNFWQLWQNIASELNELVISLQGSISAEHGIGQLKRRALRLYKDPVAYKLMQNLKYQLDPHNIMNPRKLFY